MGSRRPDTARTTLQRNSKMKLLSELLNLSSWNSTTGSLELGKKDFHAKYTVKEQLGKGGFGVVYSAVRRCDGGEQGREGDAGVGQHAPGGRSYAAIARCTWS